jgi:hypothetical protein
LLGHKLEFVRVHRSHRQRITVDRIELVIFRHSEHRLTASVNDLLLQHHRNELSRNVEHIDL